MMAKPAKTPIVAWLAILILLYVLFSRETAKAKTAMAKSAYDAPVDTGVYAGPDINPQTGSSTWQPDSAKYTTSDALGASDRGQNVSNSMLSEEAAALTS